MDGTLVLLHVDWEPLTIVGYYGPGDVSDGLLTESGGRYCEDDGLPAWRVKWDRSPIEWGYDEPTHWAPLPDPPNAEETK